MKNATVKIWHALEQVARFIDVKAHTTVATRVLKTASHKGHALYLLAVFLESHYAAALIAGGLFALFIAGLWLNFDSEA